MYRSSDDPERGVHKMNMIEALLFCGFVFMSSRSMCKKSSNVRGDALSYSSSCALRYRRVLPSRFSVSYLQAFIYGPVGDILV